MTRIQVSNPGPMGPFVYFNRSVDPGSSLFLKIPVYGFPGYKGLILAVDTNPFQLKAWYRRSISETV